MTRLIDIRSIPGSKAHPQFGQAALAAALGEAHLAYTHLQALGGRRPKSKLIPDHVNAGWRVRAFHNYADYAQTEPFRAGLASLLEFAAGEPCAMLCSEAVWWRCHRRIVTDYVLARGVPVIHLFTEKKSEKGALTPFAVVSGESIAYPADAAPSEPEAPPE